MSISRTTPTISRWIWRISLAAAALLGSAAAAGAQQALLDGLIPADGASATGRIVQLVVVLTVLSVAPGLLIMVTSFTRFVIALSFLRSGLGLQSTPANLVLISLALFMTFYVMAPTFDHAWQDGVRPLLDDKISEDQAYAKITDPFRTFMIAQVRSKDLKLFEELDASRAKKAAAQSATPRHRRRRPPTPRSTFAFSSRLSWFPSSAAPSRSVSSSSCRFSSSTSSSARW